jgi:GTPase SAR1 family protein
MVKQIKSPFKFLDAYQHEDRQIFFGREQEIIELYDRIFETNIVLIYGASGTGKTSLINCGLSNEFQPSDWLPIFIRRRDGIMDSMREEIGCRAKRKLPEDANLVQLVESLYLDYFKPVYLIFDQFEEIFILGTKDEQQAFFEELDKLLQADLMCKVIISMREEYVARLTDYEKVVPDLFDNRFRVEKMSGKNLKEVIISTAEAYDIELSNPDVVADMIVDKLRDKNHQIDLANLQVYLDRLYRHDVKRRGDQDRKIRFDEALVNEIGDLGSVMGSFLEEQLEIIETELEHNLKIKAKGVPIDILFTMVTDNATKKAIEIDEIKAELKKTKNIDEKVVDYCIDRFKEMRILRELS